MVGPAIIEVTSKVTGSYVGPFTAIADGCAIDDSEIEYSIVDGPGLDPRRAPHRGVAYWPRCGSDPRLPGT